MKSVHRKVLNQVNEGIKYPCLMIGHDGRIVLFEKYQCGTVVFSTIKEQPLGYYSDGWGMSYFTPLSPIESVTLSNDLEYEDKHEPKND